MFHASRPYHRQALLIGVLVVFVSVWLVVVTPVSAQGEATPESSMTEQFFNQPDIAAPLVVPMILALGGFVVLVAFLGWVYGRMPEDGKA